MIRFILVILFIFVFLLFSLLFLGITWIVGKFSVRCRDAAQLWMIRQCSRIILFLSGTKATVLGKEHLPSSGPVLYVLNHRSYFDILLTYANVPSPTGFIGKIELKKIPVLNLWLSRLYGLFLDRENIREGLKTILTAIDEVKNGISIAIFPEGTRGKDADETRMLPFHEGSFKIATKSGCPVVPVVITGSSAIFEDHMPVIKSTHVIMEFLPPVDPAALTRDEKKFIGRTIQEQMQEVLERNHRML